MHHYGPYAEDIDTDLTRLHLTGYININSDREGYGFHVTVKEPPPPDWQPLVAAHQQNISQVTGIFGNHSASQLELAATIHFVNRLLGVPTDETLINAVQRLKPKFTMPYITDHLNMLRKAGY